MPRRVLLLSAAACMVLVASSQSVGEDEVLLEKARALYDAPFSRNLASFSCAVQFNWKKHFEDLVGTLPPTVVHSVESLQKVQHSVKVNASDATVFSAPKTPDFGGSESVTQMEQVFTAMLKQGLTTWLRFSANAILPARPGTFHFQDTGTGYKLDMAAEDTEANLLLSLDLRITSGVTQLPQPVRFTTHFIDGPRGYVLESVTTGPATGSPDSDATFDFTYQSIGDFQVPSSVSISQSSTKPWHFALTRCSVLTSAKSKTPPSSN